MKTGTGKNIGFPEHCAMGVALGNIWNNSGVKEIVGRNPSVPN